MAYQEVTHESWFSRLGKSFRGIVTGIILIGAASFLLYWNEGRTVKTGDAIGEARAAAVELNDISKADPSFEGKVIHATGRAETQDRLQDPVFGVGVVAVKLERKVEYYQWRENSRTEKRKKLGGGEETVTTYTYDQTWTSSPIDSGAFRDPAYVGVNFVLTNVEREQWVAPNVTFGAYTLSDSLKNSIGGAQPLQVELTDEQKDGVSKMITIPAQYQDKKGTAAPGASGSAVDAAARALFGKKEEADPRTFVHSQGSVIYLGANPNAPKVGDVRVTFSQTPPANISIVSKVIGSTFEHFTASNGYTFQRLEMGSVSADNMFEGAQSENKTMAWILRVVGVLLVSAGIRMILAPLSVLADVIPLLGDIVGAGTGLVASLLGLAWGLLVIAVAWIRFRPLLAAVLLAAVVAILGLLYYRGRVARKAAGTGAA